MTRTLALSSILAVSLIAAACGVDQTPTPDPEPASPRELALSSANCQWWYRNADPGPVELREKFIKCTFGAQVVRVDTSGVGQNGGE